MGKDGSLINSFGGMQAADVGVKGNAHTTLRV